MKLTNALISALVLWGSVVNADVVVTKNGSTINGKILGIDKGQLKVQTDFAGEIEIDQEEISSFSTEEPLFLTLENGTTYLGPVSGSESGLTVRSEDGETTATVGDVLESWQPGMESPTEIRQVAALQELQRRWRYEAAFDLTGKTGNRESTGMATSFRATLEGPEDKLEFAARANFEDTDGLKSADDARGGVDYSNNFGDRYSWYARTIFGYDAIKDIEQMFTVAAGLGYDVYDTDLRKLNLRAGLGYLYESYDDVQVGIDPVTGDPIFDQREDSSEASLDLGLFHQEVLRWGTLVNRITYTPAIGDFGNYRIIHDTSLELPLKVEGWSIRTGINNDYDSEAELSNKEELDTTYYVRMVLKWL